MNFKNIIFILILSLLIMGIGCVSASEINDNITVSQDISISVGDDFQDELSNVDFQKTNESNVLSSNNAQESLQGTESDDVIVVNNWDELQYYCSLKGTDYTLKLKDNTNFYPTRTGDSNYQIKVYNNVKIIGGNGSYIGDKSSNPSAISYTAIVVPDGYKSSICFENVTFKWIKALGSPDGLFIQMGGKYNSVIKNCNFTNIYVGHGHASIVYLKKGTATLENCSFINCTSGYGCVSIYDPDNVKKIKMIVKNCYFEGNYATTEPGCINNCGVLEVYNSTFYKNRAYWWAGAIHTHGGGNTTIHDSNFTNNLAGWNGGALYTYSYLQIYNSIFSGNNCTTNNGGGAIGACAYISNPHIYIEKCLFENNANNCWSLDELSTEGTGRGGAISLMDAGSLEVHDTTFIANSASIGTAICAIAIGEYGSPDVIITNNSFINHTRQGDTLNVRVSGTKSIIEDNYFYGNSIEFSSLTLTKISEGKDQATLEVSCSLSNPSYYDADILDNAKYEVYINNEYVKTVDSKVFTIDFDELDTCDVYVIPSISNKKSNSVYLVSTREYIFVSKSSGNDSNNGLSRQTPVSTIKRALELAGTCQSILIMDGEYSEGNLQVGYDLLIKGEGDATLTNATSFIVNADNFSLKNIKINNIVGETFIKQANGNLIIDKCVFNNNEVLKLIDADNVNITKSIFTNNKLIIYNDGFTSIKNSILLNNTKVIDNNLNNIDLDYNWWGNTLNNVSKPLNLNINAWLVLNVTRTKDSLENGQTSIVQFGMYLFENNKLTKYDDLIKFNLALTTFNASVNKNTIDYDGKVTYTQSGLADSALTASYNNVVISLPFKFLKSSPNLSIKFSDIRYNDDLIITVTAPKDITGDVSVSVGSQSTTKPLTNGVKFTFKYLTAGNYNITVNYNGDGKYVSQVIKDSVNVRKYDSTTKISLGSVIVGQDLKINIETSRGTTGNVNLTINNVSEILTLKNVEASYVFKNIQRGDYLITAYYMGDDRNLPSKDSYYLEVDNLNPDLTASIADSNYGEFAIVDVDVGDASAAGWASASIDNITNSSKIINGKTKIYLKGADAGLNREVTVFYSGDDTYLNRTITATMNVFKSNFTFNMSSEDIFIGHDAVISIKVPLKTTGNFTIGGVVLSIPMSGEVSYTIPDLGVGKYTFTAVYNGNNYFTVENSTSFEVFEYPAPQWMNDGVDTKNTQKTNYTSSATGEVYWVDQINSTIIANLVIDSEGNIYMATTTGIYSYDSQGILRWIYVSDGRIGNFSGLAIGRDVIISPRAGDTIYLIRNVMDLVNQTTGEKYGDSNIYQASSIFVPIIDSNAYIYTVSEYQFEGNGYNLVITPFKIWEGGGQPIQVSLGKVKPIAPPTVNDDMMVVLCENNLMIFDAHTLSANSIKTGNFKNVRPVIGDGNIVYTILGNSIVAYTITGSQYGSKIPITGGSGDRLLIDNELGVLYATNKDGNLYSYDLFTQEETLISSLKITSGILIDGNHNLYFASDNIFYCIDSTGEVLWKSDLGSKITSTPIMNRDGVIYITSVDNKLFALTDAPLKDSELKIQVDDIVKGQTATITVTWNSEATGTVTCNINGEIITANAEEGKITKTLSGLDVGYYDVSVTYSGDMRFKSDNLVKTFVVRSADDIANNIQFDGNQTFSFSLNNAKGNLTVKINDKTYLKVLINGKASITVNDLAPGEYDALAIYSGDNIYNSANRTFTVSVPKFNITLNEEISVKNIVATVSVTLPGDATGNVTLSVGSKKYTQKITSGSATLIVDDLPAGNYTATLTYSGDSKYESASKNIDLKLTRIPVELNDDNLVIISPNVAPSVSVNLDSQATGKLIVVVDGNEYSNNLVEGSANVIINDLDSGNYTVIITYSGDNRYEKASKTVNLEVSKKLIDFNETTLSIKTQDSTAIFSVNLPDDVTGNITVSINGDKIVKTLNRGKCVIEFEDLTAGNHEAIINYTGDNNYEPATKSVRFSISMINITLDDSNLFIENLTVSVKLYDDAKGNLTVIVNGREFSEVLVGGCASLEVTGLAPGSYDAVVVYSGDDKYSIATKDITLTVPKIISSLDNLVILQNNNVINVSIDFGNDAGGMLTVNVGGRNYSSRVVNGVSSINVSDLAPGNYSALITYSGDNNYTNASKIVDLEVPKIKIDVDNNTLVVDSSINLVITLTLPGDATGTLTVNVDSKNYTQDVISGKAIVNITDLKPGKYTAHITYSGDDKYEGIVFEDAVLNIDKLPSCISVLVADINVGETALVNITTSVIVGKVTVTVNNKEYNVTVSNYNGQLSVPDLTEGNYPVTAKYLGDDVYVDSVNTTTFSVLRVEIPIDNETITIPDSPDTTVYSINLPEDATGTFTVSVDGVPYTATLVNGKATVTIPELTVGSHNITVIYSGDSKYSSIVRSVIVNKTQPPHVPVIKLTGSNLNMLYTSGKYYKVRLTSDGKALANAKVKITINGKTYTRTTDKNGYASFKVSLPPKTYTVKATYGTLKVTNNVVVKSIIKAKNVNARKSTKKVKIKVTLKKVNNKYLKNKKVTLKFNKKTFKAKTNKKGVVTFTIKKNVYKKLKTNKKYTYQVIYGNDMVKKSIKFKK